METGKTIGEVKANGFQFTSPLAERIAANRAGKVIGIECTVGEIESAFDELVNTGLDCRGTISLKLTDTANGTRCRAVDLTDPEMVYTAMRALKWNGKGREEIKTPFVDEGEGVIAVTNGYCLLAMGKPEGFKIAPTGEEMYLFSNGDDRVCGFWRGALGGKAGLSNPETEKGDLKIAGFKKGGPIHSLLITANTCSDYYNHTSETGDWERLLLRLGNRLYDPQGAHHIVRAMFRLGCTSIDLYQRAEWAKGNLGGYLRFVGSGGEVPVAGVLLPYNGFVESVLSIYLPMEEEGVKYMPLGEGLKSA